MLLLSKQDIKQVFSIKDAVAADKEAFRGFSQGLFQVPLRTQIPAPTQNGTFLFMPSYCPSANWAGLKIINIFPDNREKNLPTAPAQVFLIDGETGMLAAILDGTYVTQLRTGAASGAAFDVLGRRDAKIGAVIGGGGQSATQLAAMLAVRDLDEARVCDVFLERAQAVVDEVRADYPECRTVLKACSDPDAAIADADLIITVTPAERPVFKAALVKPGCTISCVGSYQPQMQELDPDIFQKCSKLYFDSQEAVLIEAGDVIQPLKTGQLTEAAFAGELGQVLLGRCPGRENDEEIIVFETVGLGAQDLIAARDIYQKALAAGVGTTWE